jgi:membrane fusion protein, multidrug efflux system
VSAIPKTPPSAASRPGPQLLREPSDERGPTADEAVPDPAPRKRQRAPLVLAVLVAVAAIGGSTAWLFSRGKESTDDAQVEGHVVSVSARTPGQVARVRVTDNQRVKAGDVLVELDPSELGARLEAAEADAQSAQASLEAAEAQLALTRKSSSASLRQAKGGVSQAVSGETSTRAQLEQAQADMAVAESRFKLAKLDFERASSLFRSGSISQAEMDNRQAAFDQAQASFAQSKGRFESAQAAIVGGAAGVEQAEGRLAAAQTVPEQLQASTAAVHLAKARFAQTQAALSLARQNLSYATIRAPVSGIVARRNVEIGMLVSPDRPLLALVPLDDVWIVANFKEDQVGAMRPGQSATIGVDAYDGRRFQGHVESIAGGTGSRFALLPPDNASGNYVKVVQRIPVLIRIDDRGDQEFRPGMSAEVTVRVR